MSIVLMYHGLYSDQADLQRIDPEDRPYAVSLAEFTAQMELVADRCQGNFEDVKVDESVALPEIIVTFDDGHISDLDLALPVLQAKAIQAHFFVTTGFIGKRPHFCEWVHLQQLVDCNMIVGSHGVTHRFFDDMSAQAAQRELSESKNMIEQKLGRGVDSLSFPGGRHTPQVMGLARESGYRWIFGSNFGQLNRVMLKHPQQSINRIPVRRSTSRAHFEKLINANPALFARERIKTQSKQYLKQVFGNRIYHGLYTALAKKR